MDVQAPRNARFDRLRRLARRVPGGMSLARWLHESADPTLRAVRRTRAEHGGRGLLQPFPDTWEDRYPEIFLALAAKLAGIERPRVLSLGCSDGSELRSLRRLMPQAELYGLEVNRRALAQARSHPAAAGDPAMHFIEAPSSAGLPAESFDAVLALAVLRHGELESARPESAAGVLPFARFEDALADLDARLKPGGWLAVWNAHFRVADSAVAEGYDALTLPFASAAPQALLYGRDDRRLDGVTCADVLFRKRGGSAAA